MKRLFIFCVVGLMLLALPTSAIALSAVWLISPANGFQTTDTHPTFTFDYSSTNPSEWSIVEVATKPDMASDGSFYSENIALYAMLDYPQKRYRDSSALRPGHYYWHVRHYNSYPESNYSLSQLWDFTIVSSTTLSVSSTFYSWSKAARIDGELKDANGNRPDQKPIIIQRIKNGQAVNIATVNTSYGSYTYSFIPTETASYQAYFAGDNGYLSSTSPITSITMPKKKVKIASGYHKKKCKKNKKFHAKHCKVSSKLKKHKKYKKLVRAAKIRHKKKCTKIILK